MSRKDPAHPFCDLELARRLERAEGHANARFVEARARVSPRSGACWIEVNGAAAMFDGVTSPVSQTFGLGLASEVTAEELERLERFFEERGALVSHEVSPLAGPELAALLARRGYRPIEFSNVMVRPPRLEGEEPPGRDGIDGMNGMVVRPIRSDEHELWAEVSARGWGFGKASGDGWSETPDLAEF